MPGSTPARPTASPPRGPSTGCPRGSRASTSARGAQFEHKIRPALAAAGIRIVDGQDCTGAEAEAIDEIFREQIFPVLTPLAVGPGRPFPYISNLSLSLAVWLRDPVSEQETFARVKVPKEVLPRFLPIGDDTFVPLESVIARNLADLFPGMEVLQHSIFRVTRDADFTVSDEADDLLRAVEHELRQRRFGEVVRLEVKAGIDPEPARAARGLSSISRRTRSSTSTGCSTSPTCGRSMASTVTAICATSRGPPSPHRRSATPTRRRPTSSRPCAQGDVLVHHPYDSFATSVERLRRAGGRGPRRARDQDDRVPHVRRLGARADR